MLRHIVLLAFIALCLASHDCDQLLSAMESGQLVCSARPLSFERLQSSLLLTQSAEQSPGLHVYTSPRLAHRRASQMSTVPTIATLLQTSLLRNEVTAFISAFYLGALAVIRTHFPDFNAWLLLQQDLRMQAPWPVTLLNLSARALTFLFYIGLRLAYSGSGERGIHQLNVNFSIMCTLWIAALLLFYSLVTSDACTSIFESASHQTAALLNAHIVGQMLWQMFVPLAIMIVEFLLSALLVVASLLKAKRN